MMRWRHVSEDALTSWLSTRIRSVLKPWENITIENGKTAIDKDLCDERGGRVDECPGPTARLPSSALKGGMEWTSVKRFFFKSKTCWETQIGLLLVLAGFFIVFAV